MNKSFLVVSLALICAIFVFKETRSAPQLTGNFGNFQNTSSGGISGGGSPAGEMSNRTSGTPGSGYPGGYYDRHGNDSLPTAPPAPEAQGGLDLANSTVPSACDGQPMDNVNNATPPSGTGTGAETASAPVGGSE